MENLFWIGVVGALIALVCGIMLRAVLYAI